MYRTASLLVLPLVGCPSADDETPPDACTPATPADASACVDAATYAADLDLLAVERFPGGGGWQTAQDHCRSVLEGLGFTVEVHAYGTGTNVVGLKSGMADARRRVVISAHYDSVADCTGADDNASGVAGALGIARALAYGSWDHDLVVACWDEEERGLIGSRAYAARAAADGERIDVAVSLEMIAYRSEEPDSQQLPGGFGALFPDAVKAVEAADNRGDFIALVADERAGPMVSAIADHAPDALPVIRLDVPTDLLGSPAIDDLTRSDHASFWEQDVPAIMVTDTANFRYAGYHCGDADDAVSRLDLDFAVNVTRAVAGATAARLSAD